jgi:hypothetical protein
MVAKSSAARGRARSRRSSSTRARILGKSSAARGRFTFPPFSSDFDVITRPRRSARSGPGHCFRRRRPASSPVSISFFRKGRGRAEPRAGPHPSALRQAKPARSQVSARCRGLRSCQSGPTGEIQRTARRQRLSGPARFPRVRHQPASGFREIPRSRIILRHLQESCHDAAPLRPPCPCPDPPRNELLTAASSSPRAPRYRSPGRGWLGAPGLYSDQQVEGMDWLHLLVRGRRFPLASQE